MVNSQYFPQPGSFEFTNGQILSATAMEVKMTVAEKSHEAIWKSVLGLLNSIRNDKSVVFAAEEANFYDSVCTQAFSRKGIGYDWPSDVRNRVNYRPGFSYRLNRPLFSINNYLSKFHQSNPEQLFGAYNAIYRGCRASANTIASQVQMTVSVSVVLYLIARSLYKELSDRGMTDRRWENQRVRYRANVEHFDFESLYA